MLGFFNLSMWTLLETVPPPAQERALWRGWEERGEELMVKYEHSMFICLENTHKLHFALDLYVVVVIHVIGGGSCAPADTALIVMHSQNTKFLSILWCFLMGWQRDVGRRMPRPRWSMWWITGCVCCGPCQGPGRQSWRARAEEVSTMMFCRCWWKLLLRDRDTVHKRDRSDR